jgi:hypothetical protein
MGHKTRQRIVAFSSWMKNIIIMNRIEFYRNFCISRLQETQNQSSLIQAQGQKSKHYIKTYKNGNRLLKRKGLIIKKRSGSWEYYNQ